MAETLPGLEREARDMCGVVAVIPDSNDGRLAQDTLSALYGVQHRGYDAAGLVIVGENGSFSGHKGKDHVKDVFPRGAEEYDRQLTSARFGLGHVRYATVQGLTDADAKRAMMPSRADDLFLVENGHNNAQMVALDMGIAAEDCLTDATATTAMVARERVRSGSLREAALGVLPKIEGSYCFIMSDGKELVAARDPQGIKPLSLGRMPDGGYIVASETLAMDNVNATWIRDIAPGEVLTFGGRQIRRDQLPARDQSFCALEVPYLMNAASRIGKGQNTVAWLRKFALGYRLAAEHPVDNPEDFIAIGMPESGTPIGVGYAEALGMPYVDAVTKRTGSSKSFLAGTQELRRKVISGKLLFDADKIRGKRLKVIDDSAIRGNTSTICSEAFWEAGALSIDYIFAFPEVKGNCHLGVAMSEESQLLSYNRNFDQQAARIKANSIRYMSLEGFRATLEPFLGKLCTGCIGGRYALDPPALGRDVLPLVNIS